MADGGYVAIFRRLLDSAEWRGLSEGQRCVMVGMMLMANWDARSEFIDGEMVSVPRGSFLSSEREIAERVGSTRKVVRGAISNLVSSGFLSVSKTQKRAHLKTLFTVRNYVRIQDEAKGMGPPKGPPKGPPSLYKEVNKLRHTSEDAKRLAGLLREGILTWKPDHRLAASSTYPAAWATDIDRLHRIDGVSYDRIERVVAWLPTDPARDGWDGWQAVIQSGAKLRKQFDKLEAAMRRQKAPAPAAPRNRRDDDF